MDCYTQKTFYKTSSLMVNSRKSIATLADQPRDAANLAFEYGCHLGIAIVPVLFVLEEYPGIYDLVKRKFRGSGDIDQTLEMVRNSDGILKTQQLAANHAHQSALAVASLPLSSSERVQLCKRALTELMQQVITRST